MTLLLRKVPPALLLKVPEFSMGRLTKFPPELLLTVPELVLMPLMVPKLWIVPELVKVPPKVPAALMVPELVMVPKLLKVVTPMLLISPELLMVPKLMRVAPKNLSLIAPVRSNIISELTVNVSPISILSKKFI